jgi:hypothetical protein
MMLREDEFVNYTTGEQAGCVSVGLAKGKFRRTVKACLEEVRPVLLPRSLPLSAGQSRGVGRHDSWPLARGWFSVNGWSPSKDG